jgi:hypothetical protein
MPAAAKPAHDFTDHFAQAAASTITSPGMPRPNLCSLRAMQVGRSAKRPFGEWIVQLYRSWDQPEKAAEWQAKLDKDKNKAIAPERK